MLIFSNQIRKKLSILPDNPGVYQFFDKQKSILYIGKAKNLRNRVPSYFNAKHERNITRHLVSRIMDFDYIITENEKEALLLEDTLIKKYTPPFNILLKDNKTYPYLCLNKNPLDPQLTKTRGKKPKNSYYFGPYTHIGQLEDHLTILNDVYPLKKCKQVKFPKGHKPCLYYHIKKCLPYCTGEVDPENVKEIIKEVKDILNGSTQKIIGNLTSLMKKYSQEKNYEMAREIKSHIQSLKNKLEEQAVSLLSGESFDILHYHIRNEYLTVVVLRFHEGRLHHKYSYHYENQVLEQEDIIDDYLIGLLRSFLMQFYKDHPSPINQIYLPFKLGDEIILKSILSEIIFESLEEKIKKKLQLEISIPIKGKKKRLLDLAKTNAVLSFEELLRKKQKKDRLSILQDILKLPNIPTIIESFDVANTGDDAIICAMIQYKHGQKNKKNYRLFNIQNQKQNDFLSIEETIKRRYQRILKEKTKMPDLIIIDGGKGQLNSALKSLHSLGIFGQPIIGLAKKEELIYVPKKKEPLIFDIQHPGLSLLIEIRNETHRFVNHSHRKKRDNEEFSSFLRNIPGIGDKKQKTLLKYFSSLEEIASCPEDQLLVLPYIQKRDILNIKATLSLKNKR